MLPLDQLLERQHGVLSRRQAIDHLTIRMLERRVATGRWQTVHRGVYVTHSGPLTRQQLRWAAVLSGGRSALLGGLSALETLGLRGFTTDRIDILLPSTARADASPPGVRPHRTTLLPPVDLHRFGDPPRTSPARSLIDAAQWAPSARTARAIVAAGLQQRLLHPAALRSTLARMPRAHRRALVTECLTYSAAGAETPTEAAFLKLCRRAHFPEPSMQHPRLDATGRRRYLDAYFTDYALHVEIDGKHHTDVRQWWSDMKRQNSLWIAGDRVLRFPAWVVEAEPAETTTQLRAALLAAGWLPPTC